MRWTLPDYRKIVLDCEVTAYVNTDEQVTTALTGRDAAAKPELSATRKHEAEHAPTGSDT
jgi:hypothetical protein